MQPSTLNWINPAGGDWGNAANWEEQGTGINRVPGAADDAVIDLGANNFTVTHSFGDHTVHSLTDRAAFTLSGGSLTLGSASAVGGSFAFTGGSLSGGRLVTSGAATVGVAYLSGGAVWENAGTLTLGRFADVRAGDGSAVQFRNASSGVVRGAAGADYASISVPIDSAGEINVVSGFLNLGGHSALSGPIHAAPGTGVVFGTGAGGDFTIDGNIDAAGATVMFYSPGVYTVAGSYEAAATSADYAADVRFRGTVQGVGDLTIANAFGRPSVVDFTPALGGPVALTLDSLFIVGVFGGGGLTGTDSFVVTGGMEWRGGTVSVARLEAQGGLALHPFDSSGLFQRGGVIVNAGTATGGLLTMSDGAQFENRGTLTLGNAGRLVRGDTSALLFRNTATGIVRSTAGANYAAIGVPIESAGAINVLSGDLGLDGPSTFTGPITASPGSGLGFGVGGGTTLIAGGLNAAGANVEFDGLGSFSITGSYQASSTAVDFGAEAHFTGHVVGVGALRIGNAAGRSSVADFSPATGGPVTLTLDSLFIAGVFGSGGLRGTGSFVVTGGMEWRGGTVSVARLEVQGGLALNPFDSSGLFQQGGVIVNAGTATGGYLTMSDGATFENRGTIALGSGSRFFRGDTSALLFRNSGTVTAAGGSNGVAILLPIEGPGGFHVTNGELDPGDRFNNGAPSTIAGPVIVDPGAVLNINSTPGFTVTGDLDAIGAEVTFESSGTYTFAGSYRSAATHVNFGTPILRFTGPVAHVGNLSARAVEIGSSTAIQATASTISVSDLTGHGFMTLNDAGALTVSGTLHLGLNGTAASGNYDRITVGGSVNVGTFSLELGPNMASAVGEVYTLIHGPGGPINPFAGLPEGGTIAVGGYEFRISYANGDVTLTTTAVPYHATTTTLASSADAPLYGVDGTTLTATVAAPGGATPAGTVTFYDGTTPLGTASLVGGVATLPLGGTALAVGPHALRAVYGGDGGFLGSEGTAEVNVLAPATVQGLVWVDFNDDGDVNFGEHAIAGATVRLTGFDDRGIWVNRTTQTDSPGVYAFTDLRPSGAAGYAVAQEQPAGFVDGRDSLGTIHGAFVGSDAVNDAFSGIVLPAGARAEDYNFGERPANGGAVTAGQTATIGFWQNKKGQELIKSLNGGPAATQLGDWLAATFPNMYACLDDKTNAEVAAFYKSLFARSAQSAPGGPPKVDAQVMATALAVYVTNQTLAGTTAAAYGFQVTATGVGTRTFNVGTRGAAFGVADGTSLSVMDLLLAVNARSRNGVLYDANGDGVIGGGEAGLRTMANDVFSAINEAGGL